MSIEVRGVSKAFGAFQALDDVDVSIPSGSLTALLGPSGGGKSTLLRVIAGLESPDAGQVLIDGVDVGAVPARRRGVGFVFQHYAAFAHMSVWQNVAFGLQVAKEPKAVVRARVTELLELVHLDGLAHRFPSELSGGQRQRMALARALAVQPRLLLLDEPFGALDAKVRQELRAWLRALHDQVHTTTIFVTHDQEEAMEIADEIVIVNSGRIEQVGAPEELYDHPANEFVMSFLGPVTRLGEALVRPFEIRVTTDREDGTYEAVVDRVIPLGFHCRVEVTLADGTAATVQLTRSEARQLELEPRTIVFLHPWRHVRPPLSLPLPTGR